MRTRILAVLSFGAILCLPVLLYGQASATGAVNGTVTDPTGLPVAAARVVLLAESTNITTTVTTNDRKYATPALRSVVAQTFLKLA